MNPKTLVLYSPITGNLIDLSKVPDEAFAQKMLGDGIAIEPRENFIYAPTDATVKTLHKTTKIMHKDEIALIQQVQSGNLDSFTPLYDAYFQRIYSFLLMKAN